MNFCSQIQLAPLHLDGLKYSKFLLMQFPVFGLALLPLKPVIDVWYSLGFLQIIVFFALYLGVTQNQSMTRFVRFNAQQAGPDILGAYLAYIRCVVGVS